MALFSRGQGIVPKDISNEVLSRLPLDTAEKEIAKRVYRGLRGDGFEIHVWRDIDHLCIGWQNFRIPAAGQAQLLGYRREGGYGHHDPVGGLVDNGECIVDSMGEKGFTEDYIRPNATYYYTFVIRERNKYYGFRFAWADTKSEFMYPAYLRFEERLLPEKDEVALLQKESALLRAQAERAIAEKEKMLAEEELKKKRDPPRQLSEREKVLQRVAGELEREKAKLEAVREIEKHLRGDLEEIKKMRKDKLITAGRAKEWMEMHKDIYAKIIRQTLDRR